MQKQCEICHTSFKLKRASTRFCSRTCWAKHHSKILTGRTPKNFGGKVSVTCQQCKKEFTVWRYRLNTVLFCSSKCKHAHMTTGRTYVTLYCGWCKKQFRREKRIVKYNKQRALLVQSSLAYCSPKCQKKGLIYLYSESERSGYIDGRMKDYYWKRPKHWRHIRKRILDRDGHICLLCGSTYRLSVHHIDHDVSNVQDSNLITLCTPCNAKERWARDVFEPIIRKILESSALVSSDVPANSEI